MEFIIDETRALMDKFKKSNVYVEYLKNKSIIEADPELKQQVDEFRKKSFEIQLAHNYGVYNSYENLIHLSEENDELLFKPIVRDFINAELILSKTLSKLYNCIAEEIEFDISFLE